MRKNILQKFSWPIITSLAGAIVIAIFLLIPTPRQLGLSFRYDFLPILIPVGLIVFVIFQLPDKYSRFFLFIITCAVFILPVAGLWASGQSEQYLLGGIIPFSDARTYFTDSRRLMEGLQFSTPAARRPLFAAMLSSIQWISLQNLYLTTAILTFILATAVTFAVREVKEIDGPIAGAFFLLLSLFYSQILLGKTLSEFAGLPLAFLALVLLLRGATRHRLVLTIIGLFLLTLGLNARAGAFFILPLIALWIGWFDRTTKLYNWRAFFYAFAAIVLGFAVNLLVFNLYTSAESAPFGNFSHTIYGVARGGLGWTQIYTEHPETWGMAADEQASYIYSLTLDAIQRKPFNLVKGILNSYQTFFSLDDYYGSIGWFGGEGWIGNVARVGWYILFALGLFDCVRNIKNPIRSLILFAFIGIFLSIPFAPPIDSNRMRAYAATIPFFILIPCFGLSYITNKIHWQWLKNRTSSSQDLVPIFGLSSLLILLMTILPLIPFHFSFRDKVAAFSCPAELVPVSFRILPGNHIRVVEQDSIQQDWLPEIGHKSFANRVHNLPNWETFPLFNAITPGQVILADLDLQTNKEMLLIADWNPISIGSSIQNVCARPSDDRMLRDYNVYFAEEYWPVP